MRYHELIAEDAAGQTGGFDTLFEMANLPKKDTGIDGAIRISTIEASHAPRVKYYAGRPSASAPNFSVLIAPEPVVTESSFPKHITDRLAKPVMEWVKANHEVLHNFWFKGGEMMRDEVDAMIASLHKWPIQTSTTPHPEPSTDAAARPRRRGRPA